MSTSPVNVIFDLDGTLVDSAPDICEVASSVLAARGAAPLDLAETRSFIGEGAAVFVSRMIAARDLDASPGFHAELLREFVAGYEFALDKSRFYPGVQGVLSQLGKTHPLGVCTNKPGVPTRALLRHMGIDSMFGVVVAGDTLPRRKPAPDMLLHANEALGGGGCLYVGDSEIDSQTAANAGIPFALFSGGYRKKPVEQIPCNRVFHAFDELPALAAELSGG